MAYHNPIRPMCQGKNEIKFSIDTINWLLYVRSMKSFDIYTDRLRKLRKASGMSQQDLSNISGVNQRTIAHAELGHAGRMAHETYVKLIMACKQQIQENMRLLDAE